MKIIEKTDSCNPVTAGHEPCISVYVRSRQKDKDAPPDWTRLKDLLEDAECQLEHQGYKPDMIRELVAPLYDLNGQTQLWEHRTGGLAIFRRSGFFRYHAVPFQVPEMSVVADHFYLAPLLSVSNGNQPFYFLTLSLGGAKLLQAVSGTVTELRDVSLPASPGAPGDQRCGQRDRRNERSVRGGFAILHRHQAFDNRKQALRSWFRRVDDTVRSRLGTTSSPPIILVAVPYLCPMFRHISRYQNLLEGEIHGSPDGMTPEELWERGEQIAFEYFRAEQEKIADEYMTLWHTQRISNDLRDIEAAARQGRIQTLVVGVSGFKSVLPEVPSEARCDEPHDQTQDLLELATINTFTSGGTVYAVPPEQVPGRASAAAVFRY